MSFVEKIKLKFPKMSCSFKTDRVLLCTQPQGYCIQCMIYIIIIIIIIIITFILLKRNRFAES